MKKNLMLVLSIWCVNATFALTMMQPEEPAILVEEGYEVVSPKQPKGVLQNIRRKVGNVRAKLGDRFQVLKNRVSRMMSLSPQRERVQEILNRCGACPYTEKALRGMGYNRAQMRLCVQKNCPHLLGELNAAIDAFDVKEGRLILLGAGAVTGAVTAAGAAKMGYDALQKNKKLRQKNMMMDEAPDTFDVPKANIPNIMDEHVPNIGIRPLKPSSSEEPLMLPRSVPRQDPSVVGKRIRVEEKMKKPYFSESSR